MTMCLAVLAVSLIGLAEVSGQDVPFLETPDYAVDAMLDLASVSASDTVYDLGSGDGRIVIAAASRFGARGVGIEIDPQLVELSRARAVEAGVADRTAFVVADLFESDFHEASVVALYLLPKVNRRLKPLLEEQLAPGTRVVSHRFEISGWTPRKRVKVGGRWLFLYVVR